MTGRIAGRTVLRISVGIAGNVPIGAARKISLRIASGTPLRAAVCIAARVIALRPATRPALTRSTMTRTRMASVLPRLRCTIALSLVLLL